MARLTVPSPTLPNRVTAVPSQEAAPRVSLAHEVDVPSVHVQESVEVPMPDESDMATPSEELSEIVEDANGVTESIVGASASTVPLDQLDPPVFPSRSVILHSIEKSVSESGCDGMANEAPVTVDHDEVPFRHSAPE